MEHVEHPGSGLITGQELELQMKATQLLYNLGQSIWLDNITRSLLTSGRLRHYIEELSVTGLTSNPTIFDNAIRKSGDYDLQFRINLPRVNPAKPCFLSWRLKT